MKKSFLPIVLLLAMLCVPFASALLSDNVTSYYNMSNTVNDLYGRFNLVNDGTSNTAFGKIGEGRAIGGGTANDASANIPLHQNMTLNLWVNRTATFAGNRYFFTWGTGAQYIFFGVNNGNYFVEINDGSSTNFNPAITSPLGVYQMITLTRNATHNFTLYINNTFVAQINRSPAITGQFSVGFGYNGDPNAAGSTVDEVGLWANRTLTTDEITTLWNNSAGLSPENWPGAPVAPESYLTVTASDIVTAQALQNISVNRVGDAWNQTFYSRNYSVVIGPLRDQSGNNRNITVTGSPRFNISGYISSGYTFLGNTNYFDVTNLTSLNRSYSFGGWIKLHESGIASRRPIVMGTGVTARFINIDSGQLANCQLNNATGSGIGSTTTISTGPINNWFHVICTYNQDTRNHSLYLNGQLINYSIVPNQELRAVDRVRVGRDISSSTTFNATIDEVYYFNRTLDPTEVLSMYQNSTIDPTGLVLYLPFENITNTPSSLANLTVNASDNGGYFNRNYTNYNSTTNLAAQLWQAEVFFNASEMITNATLTGGNVTINGVTLGQNAIWNLSRGNYTANYTKVGYFVKSQTFEVFPLTTYVFRIENVSNVRANFTIRAYSTNALVSANITFSGLNLSYTQAVIGSQTLNVSVVNGTYSLSVIAPGYITNISNFTFSPSSSYNYTIYMLNNNNFSVQVVDEVTFAPLSDVNWSVTSVSGLGSGASGNAATGAFGFANLVPGEYEIRYQAAGYQPRSYYVSVPNLQPENSNLTLYDVQTAISSAFVVTTTDKSNQFVDGLTVSLMRRYVVNNQTVYYVVEQAKPIQSLAGSSVFYAVPNVVPYLFRVVDSSGTVRYQGSATNGNNYESLYLIDTNLFLRIESSDQTFTKFLSAGNLSVALTNTSNTFWLSFNDVPSTFAETCLTVTKNNNPLSSQCTSASSGILSYTIPDMSNGSTYVAQAVLYDEDGSPYVAKSEVIDEENTGAIVFGILGLFLLLISLVGFAVVFAQKPALMIVAMVASIFAFGTHFLGIVSLGLATQATILITGMIVAMVLRD